VRVDGESRSYLLAEPDGVASAVVLSLHGSRSSADGQVRLSRMTDLTEAASAVVVFPEAIVPVGNGYEWDLDGDQAFLHTLIEELIGRYSPPSGRVAITGMSGGARMSCAFAAAHAELVSMLGAVGGLRAPLQQPARRVPVLAFHGTADRINPYEGTGVGRWIESVPEALRGWAMANALSTEPTVTDTSATLTQTTYGDADRPGEVTLWTSRGAGHTWPGSHLGPFLRMILGRTSTENRRDPRDVVVRRAPHDGSLSARALAPGRR
jgi:polyhydroxybutyrate depolymerase